MWTGREGEKRRGAGCGCGGKGGEEWVKEGGGEGKKREGEKREGRGGSG